MSSCNIISISNFIFLNSRKTYGLDKYFIEIEDWLNKKPEDGRNVPLLIEADEGVGKKTLIVQWIHYHLLNSRKVINSHIIFY